MSMSGSGSGGGSGSASEDAMCVDEAGQQVWRVVCAPVPRRLLVHACPISLALASCKSSPLLALCCLVAAAYLCIRCLLLDPKRACAQLGNVCGATPAFQQRMYEWLQQQYGTGPETLPLPYVDYARTSW